MAKKFEITIENETCDIQDIEAYTHYKNCILVQGDGRFDVQDVSFEKCTFITESLDNASMNRCLFLYCDLSNLNFFNAYVGETQFEECKLYATSFGKTYLKKVSFNNSLMRLFSLTMCKVEGLDITKSDLSDGWFQELKQKNVTFNHCKLSKVNFANTKMKGIDLRTCEFDYVLCTTEYMTGMKIRMDQAVSFAQQLGIIVT